MSKQKIPLSEAKRIAEDIIKVLAPLCERIEIAGSARRKKAEVGDIELVAIPKPSHDMFGNELPDHLLDFASWHLLGRVESNGHKYKKIILDAGPQLDLFIVTPPAQWGVIFMIRTGPAEYGHAIVTPRVHGGLLPSHLRVREGAIWLNELAPLETPEESDVYNLLGIPYVEPEARTA